jgi:hypothetical protein
MAVKEKVTVKKALVTEIHSLGMCGIARVHWDHSMSWTSNIMNIQNGQQLDLIV